MNRTSRRAPRAALAAVLSLLAALALSACGSGSRSANPPPSSSFSSAAGTSGASAAATRLPRLTHATLILDFTPNAVHAGIYRALAAGYYRAENLDLSVLAPGETQDPLSLVDAGRAQFGLADGSDVATQIDRGGGAQAVLAIAQQPLGGLIALASEHLASPADLQGKSVGITGVPSDTAVLDTEVRAAGGDPRRVHVVNVGFDGAQALLAHRIAAFTGFIPADGVQLQVAGHPIAGFSLDAHGGPGYPGLVAFATRATIASDPALVRAFVTATRRGYEDTLRDPRRSLRELLAANPTLGRRFTAASLASCLPLFDEAGKVPFGTLRAARIEALSRWMRANALTKQSITPARYGTNTFLSGHGE